MRFSLSSALVVALAAESTVASSWWSGWAGKAGQSPLLLCIILLDSFVCGLCTVGMFTRSLCRNFIRELPVLSSYVFALTVLHIRLLHPVLQY